MCIFDINIKVEKYLYMQNILLSGKYKKKIDI